MVIDLQKVKEIKQRNYDLTHETLHGNLPMKTVMQVVEDVSYLLELLELDGEIGDNKEDMIA